jgi:hypothetical protein
MKDQIVTAALTLAFAAGASYSARAQQLKLATMPEGKLVTITGCVQGFSEGGYFLSDSVDKKGKTKHYLLVNDNEELKTHEGHWVAVIGSPAPFSWSAKIQTQDGRSLKTGSVFGVDEVKVLQATCDKGAVVALK